MAPCRKISYPDVGTALSACRAIRQKSQAGRKAPNGAYKCESCRNWHLTSAPKPMVAIREKGG